MDAIRDFEDLLLLLDKYGIRYLIVGGLAFIYHAKPRYTKDMDLWIENEKDNIDNANKALTEFGSPTLLDHDYPTQIVQIGLAPNRVDLLVEVGTVTFRDAWKKRIQGSYGSSVANWIDIESLYRIKSAIDVPRHQEDARVLREVMIRHGLAP